MKKIDIRVVYDPDKDHAPVDDWQVVQAKLITEFGNAMLDAEKEWKRK